MRYLSFSPPSFLALAHTERGRIIAEAHQNKKSGKKEKEGSRAKIAFSILIFLFLLQKLKIHQLLHIFHVYTYSMLQHVYIFAYSTHFSIKFSSCDRITFMGPECANGHCFT